MPQLFLLVAIAVALASQAASAALAGRAAASYPPPPTISAGRAERPFTGRAMWVWELQHTSGARTQAIIARARRYGVRTLIVKSGDGTFLWRQFNRGLVRALHRARLNVCAWQYVYGVEPRVEAKVGAEAVRDGADCLVIDAEAQYEGRYVQAQAYVHTLRAMIGSRFPVALAGLAYVSYGENRFFPYSIFLGPGGAQIDMPQMYWQDIGESVDQVYTETYDWNELYQRPIAPLGQLYDSPPRSAILRFRMIARSYGAKGISWWDWQSAGRAQWAAIAHPVGRIPGYVAEKSAGTVARGATGDYVAWAQEHLVSAGYRITIDGVFGRNTRLAVESFQAAHGLEVTGTLDPRTWDALLRYRPVRVAWVVRHGYLVGTTSRAGKVLVQVPAWARAAARRRHPLGIGAGGREAGEARARP